MAAHNKHVAHAGHSQEPVTDAVRFGGPEAIARRAYNLFEERGREPGHELDDWLRAEHELKEAPPRSQH